MRRRGTIKRDVPDAGTRKRSRLKSRSKGRKGRNDSRIEVKAARVWSDGARYRACNIHVAIGELVKYIIPLDVSER